MDINKNLREGAGLTPEQEKSELAPLFYEILNNMPELDPEVQEAIKPESRLDPKYACLYENMNDMLKPGYFEQENGYCKLPGGGSYVSICTKLPGISHEEYIWWRNFRRTQPDQDLQYKLWYPGAHYRFSEELGWILEDLGCGVLDIFPKGRPTPAQMGIDEELLKASPILSMHCNCAIHRSVNAPTEEDPQYVCLTHFIRAIPGGIESRSRFWIGFRILDDKLTCVQPDLPIETAQGLAEHNAHEMKNLSILIPALSKMYRNK